MLRAVHWWFQFPVGDVLPTDGVVPRIVAVTVAFWLPFSDVDLRAVFEISLVVPATKCSQQPVSWSCRWSRLFRCW